MGTRVIRYSRIDVIGNIWQPGVGICAMSYDLDSYAVGLIRGYSSAECADVDCIYVVAHNENVIPNDLYHPITREGVEQYLMTHAGDFQEIIDFSAEIADGTKDLVFPWKVEDSEYDFSAAIFDGIGREI